MDPSRRCNSMPLANGSRRGAMGAPEGIALVAMTRPAIERGDGSNRGDCPRRGQDRHIQVTARASHGQRGAAKSPERRAEDEEAANVKARTSYGDRPALS